MLMTSFVFLCIFVFQNLVSINLCINNYNTTQKKTRKRSVRVYIHTHLLYILIYICINNIYVYINMCIIYISIYVYTNIYIDNNTQTYTHIYISGGRERGGKGKGFLDFVF